MARQMRMPPERSDHRLSFGSDRKKSLAPPIAPSARKMVWNRAEKTGSRTTSIRPAAALTPIAKESMERRKPSRRASFGSMEEEASLSQREGDCRGESSFLFFCPVPCRQSQMPNNSRKPVDIPSASLAGKQAANSRPNPKKISIIKKVSPVRSKREEGEKVMRLRP